MIPFRICIKLPILVVALTLLLSLAEGSAPPPKSKRQIYREQVLPSRGGKIPESAFASDRLALNRLNKEGISVPDGVLLEHRNVHVHPHINQHDPEDEDSVVKVIQQPDDRYTAEPGVYHNKNPFTVSSTYIIRKPIAPEGGAIRPPGDRLHYDTYSQQHQNQIYSSYPQAYLEQQYLTQVPSNKYLPAVLSTPHVPHVAHVAHFPQDKYHTNSVRPSEKYLPVNFAPISQKYVSPTPSTNIINHPHPEGYGPSISYQEIQQPLAYYPIAVPLELPNKDAAKKGYQFSKSRGNAQDYNYGSKNIHIAIDMPHFLLHYSELTNKANALKDVSYNNLEPQSLFLAQEVYGTDDPENYVSENRYARRSKEISFIEKGRPPQGEYLGRLIQVNCIGGAENTVDDRSPQCHLSY